MDHQQSHLKQSTHGDPRPDSTHFQCSNAAMNDENRDEVVLTWNHIKLKHLAKHEYIL